MPPPTSERASPANAETMGRPDWYRQATEAIPGFDLGRCLWLRRLDVIDTAQGVCVRLVLEHAGKHDVVLLARGVPKLPLIEPAPMPGSLPYAPYDLGEFLINEVDGRLYIGDELKGWGFEAQSLAFEGVQRRF